MKNQNNNLKKNFKPESLMMTAGYNPSWSEGSANPPIFESSTFVFTNAKEGEDAFAIAYGLRNREVGEQSALIYSRLNQPNLQIAEERLTIYEAGAEDCAIFSSGLAAITTMFLEFLKPGDVLLCSSPLYGGTDHFLNKVLVNKGIEIIFFNAFDSKNEIMKKIEDSLNPNNFAMIYIETPANPTNAMFDISMLREVADSFSNLYYKVLLVVDNTYMGPIWQHPIMFGADLVLYSATKYIGGHSDLIAGACLGSTELVSRMKVHRTFAGNMLDPFSCFLILRSLETLKVRMDQQTYNANKIAKYLNNHSMVSKVYFLGNLKFENEQQYKILKKQCSSNGAMIAFDVIGGKVAAFKFLNALKLAKLAVSLGSVGSLAEHPYTMTHADVDPDIKNKLGITESMVRYSVGVEYYKDLISDLKQAFKAVENS